MRALAVASCFLLVSLGAANAEINVRGFYLGMTLQEADRVMQREFGNRLTLGLGERFSFFSWRGPAPSGVRGATIRPSAGRMERIFDLPGIDDRTRRSDDGKVLFGISAPYLAELDDLKIVSLIFTGCVFGVADVDVFNAYAASYPIAPSCFRFAPDDTFESSFCYASDAIISFKRNASEGFYSVFVADPDFAVGDVNRAKEEGVFRP
jgi:hypothetical protein